MSNKIERDTFMVSSGNNMLLILKKINMSLVVCDLQDINV